jgi:hypothetical protein
MTNPLLANWPAKGVVCEETADTRSLGSEVGDRATFEPTELRPHFVFLLYRKPAYLLAFIRFNRLACIAHFNPIEPNFEVNGHHGHYAKPRSKTVAQANTNSEQLSLAGD